MTKITLDNGVTIQLTQDQLNDIARQQGKFTDYKQIKSYKDACKVLGKNELSIALYDTEEEFVLHQIKTIAKAINSLIDNNKNFPDWKNHSQYKYYPYFQSRSGSGWVFGSSGYYCSFFHGMAAYLKTSEAAEYMGREFISLYSKLLNEKF